MALPNINNCCKIKDKDTCNNNSDEDNRCSWNETDDSCEYSYQLFGKQHNKLCRQDKN